MDVARREAPNGADAILSAGPGDGEWIVRVAVQIPLHGIVANNYNCGICWLQNAQSRGCRCQESKEQKRACLGEQHHELNDFGLEEESCLSCRSILT